MSLVARRDDCSTCGDLWAAGRSVMRRVPAHTHTLTDASTLEVASLRTELFGLDVAPVGPAADIVDPAGGVTVDTAAREAVTAILDRLRDLGLVGGGA